MPEADYGRCNRWLTVATIDPKAFGATHEDVIVALEKQDIESRPVWKPLHLQKAFSQYRVVGGNISEKLFNAGICLPSGTAMSTQDIDRICKIIRSVGRSS